MIHIRAKASESLTHVMPQINCQKADHMQHVHVSATLFSTGYSRFLIQLVELLLIILLQLSYSALVKLIFSITPTLSDFFLIKCPPVCHLRHYYAFQGKIIFCLLYSSENSSSCLFPDLALQLLSHFIIQSVGNINQGLVGSFSFALQAVKCTIFRSQKVCP